MRTLTLEADGDVARPAHDASRCVACGPRCAIAPDGALLCSFMLQSALGSIDFLPVLTTSRDGGRTWSEPQPIWPELAARNSFFVSLSRGTGDDLFLFGSATAIDDVFMAADRDDRPERDDESSALVVDAQESTRAADHFRARGVFLAGLRRSRVVLRLNQAGGQQGEKKDKCFRETLHEV